MTISAIIQLKLFRKIKVLRISDDIAFRRAILQSRYGYYSETCIVIRELSEVFPMRLGYDRGCRDVC